MPVPNPYGVKVGQIWADNDKRCEGRQVKVTAISGFYALAIAVDPHGLPTPDPTRARRTRIRLSRFRPTATGYRLVREASNA